MKLNGIPIKDTFAEAFSMTAARVIVTACNSKWVNHAVQSATGFATSVIACKVEAGVEQQLQESDTPDGRPGASVLFFAVSGSELEKQLQNRIGQCILTSPTSAVFSGIDKGKPVAMGKAIRYFGDGYQISKKFADRRYWRIPVMDGEFICEDITYRIDAVGGGNFLIIARGCSVRFDSGGKRSFGHCCCTQRDHSISRWRCPFRLQSRLEVPRVDRFY